MIKRSLLLCSVPAVLSIIVTDPPPSETDYKYAYTIEDPTTGDRKSQHEVRLGDVVSGAYSVLDPDGTKRIVEYTADSKHGFKAVVREEPAMEATQQTVDRQQALQDLYAENVVPEYNQGLLQKPIAYALVRKPVPYKNRDLILFSPANEIKSDRILFDHGKYFEPAQK